MEIEPVLVSSLAAGLLSFIVGRRSVQNKPSFDVARLLTEGLPRGVQLREEDLQQILAERLKVFLRFEPAAAWMDASSGLLGRVNSVKQDLLDYHQRFVGNAEFNQAFQIKLERSVHLLLMNFVEGIFEQMPSNNFAVKGT